MSPSIMSTNTTFRQQMYDGALVVVNISAFVEHWLDLRCCRSRPLQHLHIRHCPAGPRSQMPVEVGIVCTLRIEGGGNTLLKAPHRLASLQRLLLTLSF